jgi:hypothetical protein
MGSIVELARIKWIFLLLAIVQLSALGSCPWKDGLELFRIDETPKPSKIMTKEEIKEDLECLKIILQNKYIATDFVSDIPLISRLEALINSAKSKSNDQLLDDIFELHSGFYDIHLGYKLNHKKKRSKPVSTSIVKSPTDYQFETLIKRKDHLYFRPKYLSNVLSVEQDQLISFLKSNDVNTVLDLRGNNGGDNEFAFELVRTLLPKISMFQ